MVHAETQPAVYLRLDNRPGTLDHATRILRERKVNIDALSLETVGSTGYARILTAKSRDVVEALRAAKLDAHETELIVVRTENRPGEISRLASELAAAGINVESVLTLPDNRIAVRTSDNAYATTILGKL